MGCNTGKEFYRWAGRRGQQRGEFAEAGGFGGTIGEILGFKQLVAAIGVKFAGDDGTIGQFSPFDVSVRGRARGVAHELGPEVFPADPRTRKLADRGAAAGNGGRAEIGGEAATLELLPRRQAAELDQRGIDVEQLDQRGRMHTPGTRVGRGHDERNAGVGLKVGRLGPEPVFAEMETVVAPDDHNRVQGEAG